MHLDLRLTLFLSSFCLNRVFSREAWILCDGVLSMLSKFHEASLKIYAVEMKPKKGAECDADLGCFRC